MSQGSVLIVEDEDAVLSGLREGLRDQAVTIEVARDADSAVTLLSEKRFCGLVLDLTLRSGNSVEVLRHVETERLGLAAVVIAKDLPPDVRETLDDRWVKLVLAKPIDHRLLATVVLGLCGIQT